MTAYRIAIVEDHQLLAESLRIALTARGLQVTVFGPGSPAELRTPLVQAAPHVVLLDLDLGAAGSSLGLVRPLTERGIAVVVVSGSTDRLSYARAVEEGAVGYVIKTSDVEQLLVAVQTVAAGGSLMTSTERARLLAELEQARARDARRHAPYERLTDRERDALQALADGQAVREIATGWSVSEATVRTHVQRVLHKLGVPSQLAAVAQAHRHGWLRRPR